MCRSPSQDDEASHRNGEALLFFVASLADCCTRGSPVSVVGGSRRLYLLVWLWPFFSKFPQSASSLSRPRLSRGASLLRRLEFGACLNASRVFVLGYFASQCSCRWPLPRVLRLESATLCLRPARRFYFETVRLKEGGLLSSASLNSVCLLPQGFLWV